MSPYKPATKSPKKPATRSSKKPVAMSPEKPATMSTPEKRKHHASLREQKQVGNFKLPDAPETKKGKRKRQEYSKHWIPCPLLPGVPTSPPPKIPREIKQSPDEEAVDDSLTISESSQEDPLRFSTPEALSPANKDDSDGEERKRPNSPIHEAEIARIINYGSDEDETDEETDLDQLFDIHPPRSNRFLWDQLQQEEEIDEVPPTQSSSNTTADSPPSPPCHTSDHLHEVVVAGNGSNFTSLSDFEWQPLPQPPIPWQQRREAFSANTGPVKTFTTPYEAFVAIWDRSIMNHIAEETNKYAEKTLRNQINSGVLAGYSRLLTFRDTNADELYVYFALILATGVVFKADLKEYWSLNDNIFDTPNFGKYMSYNRFNILSQLIHFTDNSVDISHLSQGEAKIHKIAPIVDHLNEKFQSLYQLGQCVALDESLTQWAGRLSINQFIKTKAAVKGIKTYEVCDSKSGYLWRFQIHSGHQDPTIGKDDEVGYITSLVLQLLRGLEYKGHTIFMDNFYNSPILARMLKNEGFDCVGTLRLNRKNIPPEISSLKKESLARGGVVGATSGDVDVLVWHDKNLVPLISTYHGLEASLRDGKVKPSLVHDYNVRMGGVDKKDQMLSLYPIERKRTAIWYKKIFRRLLNTSVLNAYVLFKESPTPEHNNHRLFRKTLITSILQKHGTQIKARLPSTRTFAARLFNPDRYRYPDEARQHMPAEYPFLPHLMQRQRRTCAICQKRVQFYCPACNIPLCVIGCFTQYH